tara:strand:- start:8706 stop:9623 length:918 start_codon:yes stop_codon:yes gene_type:complete
MNYNYILSFCICTYKRNDGLILLLDSINEINLFNDFDFSSFNVIIVDNYDGSSKGQIKKDNYKFNILFVHEKNKGLTYARNRSVKLAEKSKYCFFIDDDQIIDKNCVYHMFETMKNQNADLVYGSNPPIYKKEPTAAIDYFFQPKYEKDNDYLIPYAPTNCTLIKKSIIDGIPGPFHINFNLTGGEDSFLTRLIKKKGAKMFRSVNAKANEIVTEDRCNFRWITKRSFRCSTSIGIQDRMLNLGFIFYFIRITKAFVKMFFGFIFAIPFFLLPNSFVYKFVPWIEFVEGLGHVFGYFNIHPKEYK